MSGALSDKLDLYRLQLQNNPESFTKLYDKYVDQIYRFVYFKVATREEAEDITSEVFLKTWQYLQEKKEVKSFSGLLYRIARNCIIDLYRRKTSKPEELLEEKLAQGFEAGDAGKWLKTEGIKIENERVVAALKKLKQEYQEVITLRYVDELEVAEIAEIIGRKSIAVRVTLHRAIRKLKEFLDQ